MIIKNKNYLDKLWNSKIKNFIVMKNTHIKTLTKPIDKNTRLSVYKETLERFLNQQEVDGLCLLLPMVLWGLEHYLDDYLDEETGRNWCYKDTPTAFPELTQEVLDKITSAYPEERDAIRIKYLKEWIEKLS